MRATAQDPETAALVGVPASLVYARATAIAVATAASPALSWRFTRPSTPRAGPLSSSLRSRQSL